MSNNSNTKEYSPNYYGILPAEVRYADINPACKVFYAEITSLQNVKGYCFASNYYFEQKFSVSHQTVSSWISELKKEGFISVEFVNGQRRLVGANISAGGCKYIKDRVQRNLQDIYVLNKNIKRKEKECVISDTSFNQNDAFNEIWLQYPNRIGKKQALRHFIANITDQATFDLMKKALTAYKASKSVKNGFIQNGSTWFNNWEDWKDVAIEACKSEKMNEEKNNVVKKMEEYERNTYKGEEEQRIINEFLKGR